MKSPGMKLLLLLAVVALLQACGEGGGTSESTSARAASTSPNHGYQEFLLLLNRFQFDPAKGEPELPPDQITSYGPGEEGFYLLQLVGPTRDEWLKRLQGAGAIVIQFQPTFAYIVRMTPEVAKQVAQEDFVRAVVVYHAAYRIAPSLLQLPVGLVENVDVTIYDDGAVEETLADIKQLGGRTLQSYLGPPGSGLVTAIVALPDSTVAATAQLSSVLWLNFSSPEPGLDDEVSAQIVAGNQVGGIPTPGYFGWLGGLGLSGAGVTAAVVDTGMDTNTSGIDHPDIQGRISAFVPYTGTPATDTNGHGTHVGGVIAGNASLGTVDPNGFLFGLGVAPAAQLVVQNALLGSSWPPAGGWQQLSQDSLVNGAAMSNNSWFTGAFGAQGYSTAARTHDFMVRDGDFSTAAAAEQLIMVFSAGNSGPGASTITEPKEAKNLIVIGATENLRADGFVTVGPCGNPNNINNIANFSSRGPALDGRLLPTVVAPGTYVTSLRSATGSFGGLSCSGVVDANYVWFSGTSQAAPHATGGVALITEWWRGFNAGANPSPAMAKALLVNGAVDIGTADIPNNNEGWGRMDLSNVLNPAAPVIYMDQTNVFGASGDTSSLQVSPVDATQPLKVTVVWSDAPGPGSGGATAGWINDLDLTVLEATSTTTFLGNVFAGGFSTAGGAADFQNNLENVFIQNPGGPYEITINATNIAGDGVPLNADSTDQDFALVCSNCEVNQLPSCDANGPYVTECTAPTTDVTLNGNGSSDPNGDPLSFEWTGPFVGGVANGVMPTVSFQGIGAFGVDLEVSDGLLNSMCSTSVTVEDTILPDLTVSLSEDVLWPPNHKLVTITATVVASDTCDPAPAIRLVSITSNEPDNDTGDGSTNNDIQDAEFGTADFVFQLRAERKGNGNGRMYTVTYEVEDAGGNTNVAEAIVSVPHNR